MTMPAGFEPLLASPLKNGDLPLFNCLASVKLDGIRAEKFDNKVLSRKLKEIPNRHVQAVFGKEPAMEDLDGEFIMGDPRAPDAYRKTMTAIMSKDGEPDVTFFAFDVVKVGWPFHVRYAELEKRVAILKAKGLNVVLVEQAVIMSEEELRKFEEWALGEGYEGVMIRGINGEYKFGRSTVREGILLKLKRFCDGEAEILECLELEHNQNAATKNELGRTKRSSHKAGRVAGGKLGAMRVRDVKTGVEFQVGSGFEDSEKEAIWKIRDSVVGKLIKYRYFPMGNKEKPRFPVFLGFRDPIDM